MFKRYVMLFQQEEPLIHKVHYEQVQIIKRFFSYFVLPSNLVGVNSGKALKKLRITENDLLPNDINSQWYSLALKPGRSSKKQCWGQHCKGIHGRGKKILSGMWRVHSTEAATRQSIFENNILYQPRAFHVKKQNCHGKSSQFSDIYFKSPWWLGAEWIWPRVRKICINEKLPSAFASKGYKVKCLGWWIKVLTRYPTLFKIVTAILSIFHKPRVKGNFREMKDVINLKLGRMDIAIFESIQTVKYLLR